MASVVSSTLVDFILHSKIPFSQKNYEVVKQETNSLVLIPLKIISLLVVICGLLAMIFEIRNFPAQAVDIYFVRLCSVLIALIVLSIATFNSKINNPAVLVHILLLTIIISSGLMIRLLPLSLFVNSSIVALVIFTSSLFLSWEVKNQIIVAIYYNIVFAAAILLSDKAIYFLPNIIESVIFVLFLSVVSIIACAINFRTRIAVAEKNFEVELSEQKFRSIIDNSAEGIFQSTPDGRWLTMNKSFANILGYKNVEELLAKDVNEIYADPSDRDQLMSELKKNGQIRDYRIRLRKKDNSTAIVRLNDRIISDKFGREFFEGNIYDITDQVKVEEDRMQVEKDLKLEKEKSEKLANDAVKLTSIKSKFLANMSHEIRTPMNGILGFLTLIESGSYANENELKNFSTSARQSAESLLEIINSVLDLSKIEAGKIRLEQNVFDFRNIINQAVSVVATKASEKNIQIIKDVPENVDTLLVGDQTKIRQIYINLLGNAVKFTSHGKIKVTVRSEKINTDEIKIYSSVIDSGKGIPAEKLNSLFKPFSQVDGSETKELGGTGLGLVISKEYVSLMGGDISVKSEEGKGSRFDFHIILKKQISSDLERSIVESLVAD
ncbi:MAG TPA: ATP-binding protein, partial [Ignavibacteriaceae bacterium]